MNFIGADAITYLRALVWYV